MEDFFGFLADNIRHNLDMADRSTGQDAETFTQRARGVWYAGFRAFRAGTWKPSDAQWTDYQALDRQIAEREHAQIG